MRAIKTAEEIYPEYFFKCRVITSYSIHYTKLYEDVGWLDPMLAVSSIDVALREQARADHNNMRRRVGLVVRSGAVRSLHDIVLLSGFGVDAINPYAMYAAALEKTSDDPIERQRKLLEVLKAGIEKVRNNFV